MLNIISLFQIEIGCVVIWAHESRSLGVQHVQ